MKQIFLAPRSNETAYKNYISSMLGRPKVELEQYLSDEEKQQLSGIDTIHAWGCQPNLESRWAQMQHGDYVFFYARGKFVSIGELIFKKKSADLALALWPRSKATNEPWNCVFFVDKLVEIDLPLEDFNKVTGYDLSLIRGFMPVKTGIEKIVDKFGSVDGFIQTLKSGLDFSGIKELGDLSKTKLDVKQPDEIAKFDELTRGRDQKEIEEALKQHAQSAKNSTPDRVLRFVKSYKRNYKLVRDLKDKYQNKCQICGFTFKTASGSYYSEASHIVPISSGKEGVDSPDNIWVLCPNHHRMLDTKAIEAISKTQYRENKVLKFLLRT